MFSILILVCGAAIARPDCTPATALDVVRGPDAPNAIICNRHGQAYLAGTAIGRNLREGQWVKFICERHR